jgi:acetyltransferase-like isoleucine patch superfamily enzyme
VIGANSVVTGAIPDNCVAAGVPARVLKRLDEPPDTAGVASEE